MNILIVTTSFPDTRNADFAGKFVLNEALAYTQNDAWVRVLTPHQPGAKKQELAHEHLQVIRFRYFLPERFQRLKTPNQPMYGQRSFLSLMQIPLIVTVFLIQLLKHGRWADIIHCQWTVTALLALPCKWLFGKKIVMTVRGSDIRLLPKTLNRFIHAHVDAVVDCYGDQKSNYENQKNFPANYVKLPLITEDPAKVSPAMPADMLAAIRQGPPPFIIIYLGRFDRIKIESGLPVLDLIEAANLIRENHSIDFHIFYIGDGDTEIRARMQDQIAEYGLQHYISLLGPKKNVYDYLRFCNLGIGGIAFNAVSQEFSCLDKAQLLFEGSNNRETPWEDRVSTLFFKAQDVHSLSRALVYAMKDKNRLKNIGRQAHALMNRYVQNPANGGAAYVQAFSKLITQSK